MKTIAFLLTVFLSASSVIYAQKAEIYQSKDKFGIKQGDKTLVKAQYEAMEPLDEGFFAFKKKGKCGVITKSGTVIIPDAYDGVKSYGNGLFLVKDGKAWGLVDRTNKLILPINYTSFKFVNDQLCEVKSQGKFGLINKYGDIVIPAQYEGVAPFNDTYFLIEKDGKSGLIDDRGKVVVEALYDGFDKVVDKDLYNVRLGNKIGLMTPEGQVILDPVYDNIEDDACIGMKLTENGKIGFYTKTRRLVAPIYSKVLFYQPELGLVVVEEKGKYAVVTARGTVTPSAYENISRFSPGGIAFVEKSGKLMAINSEGREMILQEIMGSVNRPPQ